MSCEYYLFIVTGVGGMYSWELRCINRCDGSSVQDTSASILGQNWSWSWVPAPHTAWALVKVEFRYVIISVCELHQDCVITNENRIYCLRTILEQTTLIVICFHLRCSLQTGDK